MSRLQPAFILKRVTDITVNMLREQGVEALLLDVDNTLTTHNNPIPDKDVLVWLDVMKRARIRLVLVSNNSAKRVAHFAETLGLSFTSRACKPLTWGFRRAARELGLRPRQTAVVGDQIFTDIWGGNRFRACTILVEPMEPEEGPFFRFKRKIEKKLLKKYRQRTERSV